MNERVHRHPDGYREDEKLFDKMSEEQKEIEEALDLYQSFPTGKNLQGLKTEIGDELFAIICLANSKGISLDECFDLMMKKNRQREKNNYQKEKK
ncbi:MAG: MazG nucleotide pyrophosphohydrolase domain-containing protein [bacterium]